MTESSKRKKLVTIRTDESGFIKTVESDGQLIPGVYSVNIYAEAKTALAEVTIEVAPVVLDVVGQVGSVEMNCPICSHTHTHVCYENPTETSYDEMEHGQ